MKTSDFDYDLPPELIAQTPVEPRDHSRLMVVHRASGSIEHRRFYDLPEYLHPGDLMVFNESRVVPARLRGFRLDTGGRGRIELLLLCRLEDGAWRALVKPGRRMRVGAEFELVRGSHRMAGVVTDVEEGGARIVRLSGEPDQIGEVPLPPYIHEPLEDLERYQTVYAREPGSVASPTAGLHFTSSLLDRVQDSGVELAFVTLHVGWDSFRPVTTDDVRSHQMHSEHFDIAQPAADAVNRAKAGARRVISVGTTAVRLMEHAASLPSADPDAGGVVKAASGWADIFIIPGHEFQVVDALITNFHLPRSTLLMLTSAFAGRDLVLRAYREAAALKYRFYSFGDAMLLL